MPEIAIFFSTNNVVRLDLKEHDYDENFLYVMTNSGMRAIFPMSKVMYFTTYRRVDSR